MAVSVPYNRVRFTTPTTGISDITSGATFTGYLGAAAITSGHVITYVIDDGEHWEVGQGTWDGTTLARTTVRTSSLGGSKISLSGAAVVFIDMAAEDLVSKVDGPSSSTDNALARFDGTTGKLAQNSVVTLGDTGALAGLKSLSLSYGNTAGPNVAASILVTPTGTGPMVDPNLGFGLTIRAPNDTFDGSTYPANSTLFVDNITIAGATGARTVIYGRGIADGGTNPSIIGVTGQAIGRANVGGSALDGTNSKGFMWGGNFIANLTAAATNYLAIVGVEVNVEVLTGASLRNKCGITIIPTAADRVSGSSIDAALAIADASASNPHWSVGIDIGADGVWPIKSAGTVLLTRAGSAAYCIDGNATTWTSAFIRGPNSLIDGSGNATFRQLILGITGSATAAIALYGATSGAVTVQPQAAADSYNFNLPTTAGTSGQVLTSAGGVAAAMTWTTIAAVATSGSASDLSTGTLPSGRLTGSYTGVTGVGTLTAGATGVGFTVALGTSTLTGDLPFANLTQGSALSVLGVTGGSTADVASIAGTANQVLRVNSAGTALAFGAVNLASTSAVTGTLSAANGGTGFPSYSVGQILYADTSTSLAGLTAVATGNVLISGGLLTAPSWGKVDLSASGHVTGLLPYANIASATAGLSVFGRGASSTGVHADIAGTANQVLVVNGAGTSLAFGSIDLAQSAAVGTSILPKANGGFGQSMATASGVAQWNAGTLSFFDPATKRIPFGAGSHGIEDASDFTWDKTNKVLAVGATTTLDSANLFRMEVGDGTGTKYLRINGAASGTGAGAGLIVDNGGTSTWPTGRIGFFGNYSAYSGSIYDANLAIVSANSFKIYPGNTLIATFTSAAVGINTSTLDGRFNVSGVSGTSSTATFLSGASGQFLTVNFGRSAREWTLGTAGASDQFFTGTVAGSSVIAYGTKLFIGSGSVDASGTLSMVLSGGNVGIAVSPSRPFHVSGIMRHENGYFEIWSTTAKGYIGTHSSITGAGGLDPTFYTNTGTGYLSGGSWVVESGNFDLTTGDYYRGGVKVAGARDTGWAAMTNTANKATAYDTTTVTLAQLAARVKSLQDALTTHGLIGA